MNINMSPEKVDDSYNNTIVTDNMSPQEPLIEEIRE